MELKELSKKILDLFKCDDVTSLTDCVFDTVFSDNLPDVLDEYIKICPDMSVDWLQRVYQFYLSDRKGKKQDYTPVSLSRLVSLLTYHPDDKIIYDCCCGSGSLSIQKWVLNPDSKFVCEELDMRAISILLFNFCLRNIEATVVNKDILSGEVKGVFDVRKGSVYGSAQKRLFSDDVAPRADCAVANPPFNLRLDVSDDIKADLPDKYSCNYAFVAHCLQRADRCAVILPQGVLTSREEMACREYLISKGWLKAAIMLPEKMFESTPVCTCILLLDKSKTDTSVQLVDATKMSTIEEREQRGEGDASHYNRIYKKKFYTFTDEQMLALCELVTKEQEHYSMKVSYDQLKHNHFSLSFSQYLPLEIPYTSHRDFNAIIADINRVIRDRNIIRLTVNKVWAKELGLTEVISDLETTNALVKELNNILDTLDYDVKEKILESTYARISNSKVLCVENTDKEKLSSIMPFFMNMYKQHIFYLNTEENRYLAELRDSMLPFLMDGTLGFKI